MLWPISHETWQRLRVLVRANGRPVRGRELRYSPTRSTKTGEFLDKLVAAGLIARAGTSAAADREEGRWPAQFLATYTLTDLGAYAAEYGEYESATRPGAAT